MTTTTVQHHVRDDDAFESQTSAFEVDTKGEFHTIDVEIKHKFKVTLFFNNKAQMITALNDLRLTCENKIWELSGMPEYEYSDEPF